MRCFMLVSLPFDGKFKALLQHVLVIILVCVEVKMEYRVFLPLLFQLLHGQSLEQVALAAEVGRHR